MSKYSYSAKKNGSGFNIINPQGKSIAYEPTREMANDALKFYKKRDKLLS